jgi:hypothetical protein
LRITFAPRFPKDLQRRFAPLLKSAGAAIPGLGEIILTLADLPGGGAQTNMEPEYRRSKIAISADFLHMESEDQEMYLLHELAHYVVAPLSELAQALAKGNEVMEGVAERAMEGVVEDMSRVWAAGRAGWR